MAPLREIGSELHASIRSTLRRRYMMPKSARAALGFAMAVLFGSQVACESIGTMTFVSATDVDLDSEQAGDYVTGEDCGDEFLMIPLSQPRLEDAIDDALSKAPEANLLRGVWISLDVEDFLLVGKRCISVSGVPETLQ